MIHQDLVKIALKLENHQKVLNKEVTKVRILNPLVIIVIRRDILLMCVGAEDSINQTHPRVRVSVTSATCKDI